MADNPLQFADIGNAILAGSRAAYQMGRSRREAEAERRRADAQQFIEPAVRGDAGAFAKLASADPTTASAVGMALSRMDASTLARAKAATDYTSGVTTGLLAAPEGERERLYQQTRADAQARGMDISRWPASYDPAWVQMQHGYGVGAKEWFQQQQQNHRKDSDQPIRLPPLGSAPTGTPGAPNRDQFVQTMMPHALAVAQATGLDPRLVLAQSALETGYGASAPGNNYFGIKSHGQAGGQTLPTTEVGPGGAYQTQDSFRTYADPGASARDYVNFLQTNSRYQPLLAAKGFDAQLDALGRSGYATDPQYAAKLRQIAATLPAGLPASGNPTPLIQAQAPANGIPGPIAQGDTPQADASGTPMPPQGPPGIRIVPEQALVPEVLGLREQLRVIRPGWGMVLSGKTRQPSYDSQGRLHVYGPSGEEDFIEIPKFKERVPHAPPSGYRESGGGLEYVPGGPADPVVIERNSGVKRAATEKVIPQTITKGMQENVAALKQLDRATALLDARPDSVGGIGSTLAANIPGVGNLQNRNLGGVGDPEGAQLRAAIADIGSMLIHDRSGAAVSASEFPRLRPFVPSISDDPATIRRKLANFRAVYDAELRDATSYYGADNGFKPYGPAVDYLSGATKGEPGTPTGATPPATGAPAASAPPAPTSLKLPPKESGTAPRRLGANGEGYDQIPAGAQYIAPDGTTRTKGGAR